MRGFPCNYGKLAFLSIQCISHLCMFCPTSLHHFFRSSVRRIRNCLHIRQQLPFSYVCFFNITSLSYRKGVSTACATTRRTTCRQIPARYGFPVRSRTPPVRLCKRSRQHLPCISHDVSSRIRHPSSQGKRVSYLGM